MYRPGDLVGPDCEALWDDREALCDDRGAAAAPETVPERCSLAEQAGHAPQPWPAEHALCHGDLL